MMKIVKAEEMRYIDENSINLTGIPSLVLMESAGRGVFEVLMSNYGDKDNFLVVAGSGNNGGDGVVVARYLLQAGKKVNLVVLSEDVNKLSNDNRENLKIFENLGGEYRLLGEKSITKLINLIKQSDVVVDAIFGTGFKPPVKGYREKAVDYINKYAKAVVSVDIPSGLSADTGEVNGKFVKANITITFAYPKLCHILYPASQHCGDVYVVNIGIDENYAKHINRFLVEPEDITLPERKKDSHKYTYGHNLIVGGSVGKSGAVILSALASSRAGAGLTTVFVPEEINSFVETNLIDEMSIPAPSKNGVFSRASVKKLRETIKNGKFSSITAGMGMSVSDDTAILIKEILNQKLPVVLDADGINNLIKLPDLKKLLKKRKHPTVLTPHLGEFSRLVNVPTNQLKKEVEDLAVSFSKEVGVYLVVKFSRVIITTPEGKVFYITSGNEALAKAGTGDVLAGIIGALINRLPVEEALKTSVFIHGFAGRVLSEEKTTESVKAIDVAEKIPEVYRLIKSFNTSDNKLVKKLTCL